MSNARIILRAIGEQDNYISQNTRNTFFLPSNKTHTQFGSNWIVITNNDRNRTEFIKSKGSLYFRIPEDGDIIKECYIRIKIPNDGNLSNWKFQPFQTRETLFNIIDSIEFFCDQKVLSKLDSEYIFSYFELNCNSAEINNLANTTSINNASLGNSDSYIYLTCPIPLWFHKNPGSSFPIWALNHSNVGIKINLKDYDYEPNTQPRKIHDIELLTEFGYLSQEEKDKFKNTSLEYIIEVPEKIDSCLITKTKYRFDITKTHYIKYLFWFIKDDDYAFASDIDTCFININGNYAIDTEQPRYYSDINRYRYFNSEASMSLDGNFRPKTTLNPIYIYSFSLEPIEKKTSGFISTQKFNTCSLEINFNNNAYNKDLFIYSVKHNIVRFKDGSLSLLFNN
jgi:hypothetical protein